MKTGALFTALCLAATLLAQGTVKAQNTLDFTENSPTSLTVALNGTTLPGSSVNNTAPDAWTVTLAAPLFTEPNFISGLWIEPENSSLMNTAQLGPNSTSLLVRSDASTPPPPLPSETPIGLPDANPDGAQVQVAFQQSPELLETFHDNAKTPEAVPEPSTVALLGVGLIGIGFACRKIRRNPVTLA
jgi:hypothetical protein